MIFFYSEINVYKANFTSGVLFLVFTSNLIINYCFTNTLISQIDHRFAQILSIYLPLLIQLK